MLTARPCPSVVTPGTIGAGDPVRVEHRPGHGVTVVDSSALAHATVLVSGGRRGLDLELSPADLIIVTGATIAAIARTR